MSRQYQKKQHLLYQIKEMLASGMTQKEVEAELELTGYRPVHELLKREHKKNIPGMPKPKGRPHSCPLAPEEAYKREIARLQMENKLLRDFSHQLQQRLFHLLLVPHRYFRDAFAIHGMTSGVT